jgi:hypothetical protein
MFLIPVFALYSPIRVDEASRKIIFIFFGLLFAILIGLRHEVGGDWIPYMEIFNEVVRIASFDKLFAVSIKNDFGYVMLNYYVNLLGGNIYLVNLICALIFVYGVWRFAFLQENSWLVLIISIPFLTHIVAMGYTRQSVAIGFIFAAIANLQQQKKLWFWIQIFLAAIFYKIASVFILLGIMQSNRMSIYMKIIILLSFSVIFYIVMESKLGTFYNSYIALSESGEQFMVSAGAIPRVLMNVIPATILFLYLKDLQIDENIKRLFILMSLAILITFPLVFWRSTPVDRMHIFLIPVQLLVLSRLSFLVKDIHLKQTLVLGVVISYAFVLFVWFNFSHTLYKWVPYDNLLIQ